MRVLALDTTTRAGSAALVVGEEPDGEVRVADERPGDPSRSHAERLPSELSVLLDANGLSWRDIDLFAVASGPGSFTGLRVGIATMQGLALVVGRPIVGVPALVAMGHLAARQLGAGRRVGVWIDAHRREVFAALFEVERGPAAHAGARQAGAGRVKTTARLREKEIVGLTEAEGATVGDPAAALDRWRRSGIVPSVFVGDGARLYEEIISRMAPGATISGTPPLAGVIGLLALERVRRGEVVTAADVQPLYVRRPDAELAREHALANRSADIPGSN
ncbi:MAG TPA: tRNA (adenosine(37)-N6)-threonylcarbamoyltransferase complex dimerization subunit type 1 TsaB [Vicinamibacterales bacterium]|jgi:tRNA threonylcarbamoyladenosine biosynthesis protein TsaB|nr:tRNA (adenosine(37)-N6)-threonylcarbamoyltransferase complex dimerization subunit type 1 TsaB [Vicinamibacterales bacterium]